MVIVQRKYLKISIMWQNLYTLVTLLMFHNNLWSVYIFFKMITSFHMISKILFAPLHIRPDAKLLLILKVFETRKNMNLYAAKIDCFSICVTYAILIMYSTYHRLFHLSELHNFTLDNKEKLVHDSSQGVIYEI